MDLDHNLPDPVADAVELLLKRQETLEKQLIY